MAVPPRNPRQTGTGQAESALRELGFPQTRVHAHDNVARIELPEADLARALDPATREKITAACKALGFLYVTLNIETTDEHG